MSSQGKNLQAENRRLRQQLRELVSEARHNEEKKRRFDELELQLIGTRTLSNLVRIIIHDYRTRFHIDAVTIVLIDSKYEIRRIIDQTEPQLGAYRELVFVAAAAPLEKLFGFPPRAVLGPYDEEKHHFLFAGSSTRPASVAILPLSCHGHLIGSLNLGSQAGDRYVDRGSSDFLEHLAAVLAICLENTLNNEKLKRSSLTDALTGIFNRGFFDQRIKDEIARAFRYGQPLSCLFLDLDHFKKINDLHGHQTGDEVLRQVAALISGHLRRSDILARYGGEEFVILLPQTAGRHAADIAERIRKHVAAYQFTFGGKNLPITISIGVATLKPEENHHAPARAEAEKLIETADAALLQAKEAGRNRVVDASLAKRP